MINEVHNYLINIFRSPDSVIKSIHILGDTLKDLSKKQNFKAPALLYAYDLEERKGKKFDMNFSGELELTILNNYQTTKEYQLLDDFDLVVDQVNYLIQSDLANRGNFSDFRLERIKGVEKVESFVVCTLVYRFNLTILPKTVDTGFYKFPDLNAE